MLSSDGSHWDMRQVVVGVQYFSLDGRCHGGSVMLESSQHVGDLVPKMGHCETIQQAGLLETHNVIHTKLSLWWYCPMVNRLNLYSNLSSPRTPKRIILHSCMIHTFTHCVYEASFVFDDLIFVLTDCWKLWQLSDNTIASIMTPLWAFAVIDPSPRNTLPIDIHSAESAESLTF